jgi:hypothetical protein
MWSTKASSGFSSPSRVQKSRMPSMMVSATRKDLSSSKVSIAASWAEVATIRRIPRAAYVPPASSEETGNDAFQRIARKGALSSTKMVRLLQADVSSWLLSTIPNKYSQADPESCFIINTATLKTARPSKSHRSTRIVMCFRNRLAMQSNRGSLFLAHCLQKHLGHACIGKACSRQQVASCG